MRKIPICQPAWHLVFILLAACMSPPAGGEAVPGSPPAPIERQAPTSTPLGLVPTLIATRLPAEPSATARPAVTTSPPAILPTVAAGASRPKCDTLPSASSPPAGRLGSADRPVVIVFEPYRDANRIAAAGSVLANCLSQMTGLTFKSTVGASAAAAVEAMGAGRAHAGFLDTPAIVRGRYKYRFSTGLVVLRTFEGRLEPYYTRQFIAGKSSGIRSIADLRGKSFCFGEPDSSFGTIVPRIVLAAHGIHPDRDLGPTRFAGFADQIAVAVYKRECDAGTTYVDTLTDPAAALSKTFPDIQDKVGVIYVTERIPHDGVQYVQDLEPEISRAMNEALLALAPPGIGKREPLVSIGKIEGFIKADNSFYADFEATVKRAGIDPGTLLD